MKFDVFLVIFVADMNTDDIRCATFPAKAQLAASRVDVVLIQDTGHREKEVLVQVIQRGLISVGKDSRVSIL